MHPCRTLRQPRVQIFKKGLLPGFVAMQLKTEIPEANFAQAPPHDFEGGEFLGNKKDSFAAI